MLSIIISNNLRLRHRRLAKTIDFLASSHSSFPSSIFPRERWADHQGRKQRSEQQQERMPCEPLPTYISEKEDNQFSSILNKGINTLITNFPMVTYFFRYKNERLLWCCQRLNQPPVHLCCFPLSYQTQLSSSPRTSRDNNSLHKAKIESSHIVQGVWLDWIA